MADNNAKIMKKEVADGNLRRIYIMYGEERYLLEHQLEQLRAAAVAEDFADFNLFKLDGTQLTPRELSDALEAAPAFSETKLVIVTDLDLYKLSGDLRDEYVEALTDIPEYTTLAIVYDAVEYKPDKRQNLYKFLSKNALEVNFELQDTRSLTTWLRRRADALSKQLDPRTAEHMLFVCGSSMTTLIRELEKAAAYSVTNEILPSDIDAVCERTLEADVFELSDAIAARNTAKALQLLSRLEALENEPIMLLAAIGSQMRRLLIARLAIDANKGAPYVAAAAGVPPFAANKILTTARRLTLDWCMRAAELCAECDNRLKTSSGERSTMLEMLILQLGGTTERRHS